MSRATPENSFWRQSRAAILRGLGVVLPSLLTVIFLLWLWNSIERYVLSPIESATRQAMVERLAEIYYDVPGNLAEANLRRDPQGKIVAFRQGRKVFVPLISGEWIPEDVFEKVRRKPGRSFPTTAEAVYNRYLETRWFRPAVVVVVFFCVFLLTVYLLGKIIAARIGSAIVHYFERQIDRLPIVSTIYGTVKQVTDIVFSESTIEFNRVVAVQYPRPGIWSLGFATGESLNQISDLVDGDVLSVFIPSSPMPATGYTITVPRRDIVDLNISVDQAVQFVISCGMVTAAGNRQKSTGDGPQDPTRKLAQNGDS